jgi:hypothetical protein
VNHDQLADRIVDRLRPEHLPDGQAVVDCDTAVDAIRTVKPPEWAADTVAHSLLALTARQQPGNRVLSGECGIFRN